MLEDEMKETAVAETPQAFLERIGKDSRLIAYSSKEFGTPLDLIDGLTVPNELFFIRSYGPILTNIEPDAWRLKVTGLVEREIEITLDDLKQLPQRTMTAFLECSGNSRSGFEPDTEGTKWSDSAIGNAEWHGVSLSSVLNLAGVKPGAVDVVTQGADLADMQRGLPIDVAMGADVMLVWQMNGAELPRPNGGPVRLLVPGWGGIASTKWIVGLNVIDHAFAGHYNRELYTLITQDEERVRPVREMPVKSVIVSPRPGETVSSGEQTMYGYAWSGYGAIKKVEVSTDGGSHWQEATITHDGGRRSWIRFEHRWAASAGSAILCSRAIDERGLQQPEHALWNVKGYQMNAISHVPITID
jgi:DMSO/TMAO reductase YedYZ molybdopterin-dependent catalytic subunit